MTHASAATRVSGWREVTQTLTLAEQLRSDVPALELEIFRQNAELLVCNNSCADGSAPFGVLLAEVRQFLEAYGRSTVTLFLRMHAPAAAVAEAFSNAKLSAYHFRPTPDRKLPTLGELIDSNTRLVVFAEWSPTDAAHAKAESLDAGPPPAAKSSRPQAAAPDAAALDASVLDAAMLDAATLAPFRDASELGDAAPAAAASSNPSGEQPDAASGDWPDWLLPMNDWVKQTNPNPRGLGDINCTVARGAEDAPVFILHLHAPNPTTGLADVGVAEQINSPEFLLDRLGQCALLGERQPSFIAFDFVELGAPQTSVLRLNLGQPVVQEIPGLRDF